MCLGVCSHESRSACTLENLEPKRKVKRAKRTSEFIVYGQASVVSRPPPTVWSGRGGAGLAGVRRGVGVVAAGRWGGAGGGQGSHASPTQAINPIMRVLLLLLTLTGTLHPTHPTLNPA